LGPCRRLSAWVIPAPWPGVDSGGHGQMVLEFDDVLFRVETSRICRLERPRWWVLGTEGAFVKSGIDPQEDALRRGDIDQAAEPPENFARLRIGAEGNPNMSVEEVVPTVRGHWDGYYANVVDAMLGRAPLAVTAEQARDVVRLLEAATRSAAGAGRISDPWGSPV
jgi:scyllo-inositol 2-dehydrogenase (NADP+)